MSRSRRIAALVFLAVLASAVVYLILGRDNGNRDAQALLEASQVVMAAMSFSHTLNDCPTCPPPVVTEYASPDRIRLSNSKGHDDWTYVMYIGQKPYVSQEGLRWREGLSGQAIGIMLNDPRFLFQVVRSARIGGSEAIQGRSAAIVGARFDFDLYLEALPPAMLPPDPATTFGAFRELFDGAVVRFWIDKKDHRVLQLEWSSSGGEGEARLLVFDYAREVRLPDAFASMPAEAAFDLSRETEPHGERLLAAVRDYYARYRAYPPNIDAVTLAEFLPASEWPANVFSGQPMRNATDSPGDFLYLLKNNGSDIEFTLHGWDGAQMFTDTERFGPLYRGDDP
jgi:hypothetical protein